MSHIWWKSRQTLWNQRGLQKCTAFSPKKRRARKGRTQALCSGVNSNLMIQLFKRRIQPELFPCIHWSALSRDYTSAMQTLAMQVDGQCFERVDASQKTSTPSNARRVNCVLGVERKLVWNQFLKCTRRKKKPRIKLRI